MSMTTTLPARRSGRPFRQQTVALRDKILNHATKLFFADGYGATSMEAVAKKAGMTKRTLYARFANKAELFRAVVERVIEDLRRPVPLDIFEGSEAEAVLLRLAPQILRASLSPAGLALHRLLVSEASRFPELAQLASRGNTREEVIQNIANVLRNDPRGARMNAGAGVFLRRAVHAIAGRCAAAPRPRPWRAADARELDFWPQNCVMLFMAGCYPSEAV